MDSKQTLDHWEVDIAGRFDMLASERDAPGRVFFTQLGANISEQARFVQLMPIAGREFMNEKKTPPIIESSFI